MKRLLNEIANSSVMQQVSLLPQALKYGDIGIDFLIECLDNTELEIRAAAYNLLRDIDSQKAQKAITPGLLLNPGDKIYSVYKALIWFTDESYLLFDDINYLQDIREQVYGRSKYDDEGYWNKDKRIYCCLDKNKAIEKAETIHRNLISKHYIGDICGFYWERKNPDFDLKLWCLENNLVSNKEWNDLYKYQQEWRIEKLIWEHKDKTLKDKYIRNKYIYHLSFVDEWLKENRVNYQYDKVNYEYGYQNWNGCDKLLDYLKLPENIELLSKFWKDGVGHFAFVREEFVQQKAYIKIEDELYDRSSEDKTSTKLIARPENYAEQASNYLIKIIRDRHTKSKHKLKAYELLHNFDTDAAKQTIAEGVEEISIESVFDLGEEIDLNSIRLSWDGNPN